MYHHNYDVRRTNKPTVSRFCQQNPRNETPNALKYWNYQRSYEVLHISRVSVRITEHINYDTQHHTWNSGLLKCPFRHVI